MQLLTDMMQDNNWLCDVTYGNAVYAPKIPHIFFTYFYNLIQFSNITQAKLLFFPNICTTAKVKKKKKKKKKAKAYCVEF